MHFSQNGLGQLTIVIRPALLAAPKSFLADIRAVSAANGVQAAVARQDTKPIFDALVSVIQYQGIFDAAADGFTRKYGSVSWDRIDSKMQQKQRCPLLLSYWDFSGCHYLKSAQACSHPADMPTCIVAPLPLRKGILNQSAVSLYLFIRDVWWRSRWLDR